MFSIAPTSITGFKLLDEALKDRLESHVKEFKVKLESYLISTALPSIFTSKPTECEKYISLLEEKRERSDLKKIETEINNDLLFFEKRLIITEIQMAQYASLPEAQTILKLAHLSEDAAHDQFYLEECFLEDITALIKNIKKLQIPALQINEKLLAIANKFKDMVNKFHEARKHLVDLAKKEADKVCNYAVKGREKDDPRTSFITLYLSKLKLSRHVFEVGSINNKCESSTTINKDKATIFKLNFELAKKDLELNDFKIMLLRLKICQVFHKDDYNMLVKFNYYNIDPSKTEQTKSELEAFEKADNEENLLCIVYAGDYKDEASSGYQAQVGIVIMKKLVEYAVDKFNKNADQLEQSNKPEPENISEEKRAPSEFFNPSFFGGIKKNAEDLNKQIQAAGCAIS